MTASKALEGRRFLFVTGKGGVGKTTITAALALALKAQGRSVLCVMCQEKERLSKLLGGQPVGDEIVEMRPGIMAVNIDPETALREYGEMVLRFRTLYNAVFDNRVVKSLLRATPGLYEWAMLGKAWYHTTEYLPGGRPRFDVVVFDAPSTGHALEMLRGPKAIVDVAPPGLLRREAAKAWTMFTDPKQTGVVLATLAEETPVTETLFLYEALTNELSLPVSMVVVNKVYPPLLSQREREAFLGCSDVSLTMDGNEALAIGFRRAQIEQAQNCAIMRLLQSFDTDRFGSNDGPTLCYLPYRFDGVKTPASVFELSLRLA